MSYKNDLILGGVVGQDASRGTPFPQNAVQEFQVLTQNFKAEYEKASSAIITAITQERRQPLIAAILQLLSGQRARAARRCATSTRARSWTCEPKPTYERWQWGVSLGGPIVRTACSSSGPYEENRQDRANRVSSAAHGVPAAASIRLRPYEGTFTSPFRERLLFGKVSFQPAGQHVEVTYNLRNETDIRGFGGQRRQLRDRRERAQPRRLGARQVPDRRERVAQRNLLCPIQRSRWNPEPENYDIVGENSQGCCASAGATRISTWCRSGCRCATTTPFPAVARHPHAQDRRAPQLADYDVRKEFERQSAVRLRRRDQLGLPRPANYGVGDPDLSSNNWQFGLFVQDDWAVGSRLTLNLGCAGTTSRA